MLQLKIAGKGEKQWLQPDSYQNRYSKTATKPQTLTNFSSKRHRITDPENPQS